MATANIRAVITAEDNASQVVSRFGKNIGSANSKIVKDNQKTAASFNQVLVATAGTGIAAKRLVGVIQETVTAANKEQSALTGLTSITKAFGQDTNKAMKAAQSLAKDGLMTVGDAALALKNLLAAGFNLDQAIKLVDRFKDTAAFGRQAALGFGQAITSATEGIKNGNSILVDNAGLTKNLSVILEEAGFSAQDLMKATTDASVRQALFNGILKESNPMLGDASKLTELYAGKQAMLDAKTQILKARIGEALQPALLKLVQTVTPLVEKFAKFAEDNPKVVAAVILITTAGLGLIAVLGSIGLAIMGLTPILAAFGLAGTQNVGMVSKAFVGLRALVATPIVMPALAVAAALASIALVYKSWLDTKRAIQNSMDAMKQRVSSDTAVAQRLLQLASTGDAKQRAQALKTAQGLGLNLSSVAGLPSYASGTDFHPGGMAIVGEHGAELVNLPRGSSVTPNNKMGGTININLSAGAFMGSEVEARKYANKILDYLKDSASSKGMTLGEMIG